MMSKLSLHILIPLVLSRSATAAAALSSPSHVTQPALLQPSVDHSTVPVTEGIGAEEHAEMILILLTTVASTLSGNYPLASSAAVTNVGVVCASASEDTKTMDTMDDDTDVALACLDKDNYFDVIDYIYCIIYMLGGVQGGIAVGSDQSTVVQ